MKNNNKLCLAILLSLLIILLPTFLLACNEDTNNETENLGGVPNHILPIIPPEETQDPPINNNDTPTIDPDENEGDENQGGGEQTPEVHNLSFEGFMTNRAAIAQKIVEENESAILLSNATKALAGKSEIVSYRLNLIEGQDCNEISAFEITYIMQNTTNGDQYIATSTITISETITDSNYEDLTIANIQGNGKTGFSATQSQNVELKTALAQAFLAEAGISFDYTSNDIRLSTGGTSVSQTYGSVDKYIIIIDNDNGYIELDGYVKTSSNPLQEIEKDHIQGVTCEKLEDFHTIAEHNANCNKD